MTSRAQDILQDALALPLEERADVAAELLASLDDAAAEHPADVEAAWTAEIERRARLALADESGGVAWDDVRRRAEGELRQP
ncbi:MAG TPA: addiction module protein [Vicinamibacterales bacterium]|nr:addiction module protein [Vicinamibacterales bacterium]HVZ22318.1 addiction module protein [Vicinamibacterales bacterium]